MAPLVIRIRLPEGNDVDWNVPTASVSFSQLLEVISHVLHYRTVTAFEYEDEEGDRITVRTDDDVTAMISHFSLHNLNFQNDHTSPFVIYPKVSKSEAIRNIHQLRVETKLLSSSLPVFTIPESQSCKQSSSDLQEILSVGKINEHNLEYIEILGHGNFGTVYRAIHKSTNQVMAVKIMPLDITPETQRQIMSELEILYKCNSPFIIAFFGAFFQENRISICTEFMTGRSLDLYGKIPEDVLGRVAVAIVKGLNYLWSLKIMHRDIKPSNMLINSHGHVKLCDFNVSVQLINSIAYTFIGTQAYMAPERINGDEYGIHSEVWSLGISFLEMALGKFPYEKSIKLLQSIVNENPPVLPNGEFSEAFCDFIAQCMQKVPKERPSPESLMQHPFCQLYSDGNLKVIADWMSLHKEKAMQKETANS